MRFLLAAVLLTLASVAQAAPLTVRAGESWLFTIKEGQPAEARKVDQRARPAKGELMVTVRALFGTAMIITNNSAVSYSFNAELVPGRNVAAVKTCTLPADAKPVLEQWDQRARAVRISNFRAAGSEGRC
jgi:hypothetical protein